MAWLVAWLCLCLSLCGCVQTQWRASSYGPTTTLRAADQTMDLEVTDRIERFRRLANMEGVTPPEVEEVTVAAAVVPGAARPIPVIRVTFEERDFFESGSAGPQPAAGRILQVVADNMRRDVPDVRVTVLGHTDASGTDQQNMALSQARAQSVIESLVAAGVNPGQLSAVAIGRAQPVAPNATAVGRARNRRVEFLISPSELANLAAVSVRAVNPAFLVVSGPPERSARRQVAVLKPTYSGPTDVSEAPLAPKRSGRITLAAAGSPLTVGSDDTGSPVSAGGTSAAADDTGSPVSASFAPAKP